MGKQIVALRLLLLAGLSLGAQHAAASFQFFGNARQVNQLWNDSAHTYVTVTSIQFSQIGYVQLANSSILVNPCGSYLDVIEDGWLSGSMFDGIDPTTVSGPSLEFDGSFQLPAKSVLVGAMVWAGNQAFSAHLDPALASNQFPYSGSGNVVGNKGEALLQIQQTSDAGYHLSVFNASLGGSIHVRIRYLVANAAGGTPVYTLPVLFASDNSTGNPSFLQFQANVDSPVNGYILKISDATVMLNDSSSNNITFAPSLSLTAKNGRPAILRLTSFNGNDAWLGNYLMLNANIADSVIGALSKKIETIVLWRWNQPGWFVDNYYQSWNQQWSHTINGFGQDALNQAQGIASLCNLLAARGHRTGLIHSIEGDSLKQFPLASKDSKGFLSMQAYLEGFDQNYLLSKYSWNQQSEPSNPRADSLDIVKRTTASIADFIKSVHASIALYSDSTGTLHHLVIITAGPSTSSTQLAYTTVDSLLQGATYDGTAANWRGVSFGVAASSINRQKLVPYFGYNFPSIEPVQVSLKFRNAAKTFNYLFNPQTNSTFAIIGKSSTAWDTMLVWTGTDNTGNVTGSFAMLPSVNRAVLDSGLVKLWAADKNRLKESVENDLGGTYGILTRAYTLTATTADSTSGAGAGVHYLTNDQISSPEVAGVAGSPASVKIDKSFFGYAIVNNVLTLKFGAALTPTLLRIYDLRGRLIATIFLTDILRSGIVSIPLDGIMNHKRIQSLVACVEGSNVHKRFKVVLR
jgi:hypothetical protein